MNVQEFEEYIRSQKPVAPSTYDSEYFTDDWREKKASYTLETRREIEGRNPALIKEVFEPKRVLDMGCGPGNLMYFLHELGLDVHGVDASEHSRRLAPESIAERISISTATKTPFADNSFDLVICREVLEHLTVLEVAKAAAEMSRVTSRFIYITTRYHPNPASLIDITTQFDVDPTHITLLTKDFMRVLFVLTGLRSRPDLEARMDWLGKGRVLVFEKTATA
jgi:2-polyprenyl-3-methyl-5-hydroxy-6-metoxy-1,4-benzoquinol methylase